MKKFLPKTVNNPRGFTLIELLVVVSIIAFLSVIGAAAFGNAQAQARDGKRRADIDAISKALESNFSPTSSTPYPVDSTAEGGTLMSSGSNPTDPGGNCNQSYSIIVAAQKTYTVCAKLEKGNGNADGDANGSAFTNAGANAGT